MVNWSHGKAIGTSRRTGNHLNMSTVFYEFTFQRRTGFFLLQVTIKTLLSNQHSYSTSRNSLILSIYFNYHLLISDLHSIDINCILFVGNILADKNRKRRRNSSQDKFRGNYSSHRCNNWLWWKK